MFEKELEICIQAIREIRPTVLDIYYGQKQVEIKDDGSPVTLADKLADKFFISFLSEHFPSYGFLTEESVDTKDRLFKEYIWIIDPIDGTKDFVENSDEFTQNIALCHNHEIVLGIVYAPITDELYYAIKGQGAYVIRQNITSEIHVNTKTKDLTCLISKFHHNEYEEKAVNGSNGLITTRIRKGASLKPCVIAEGNAEITFRYSPNTKEWDTAAPQIILEEAGGILVEPDGNKITYNRVDVYNKKGYIATNNIINFQKFKTNKAF